MSRSNGAPGPASPGSLVGNIAEFGNDVATLAELQVKLAVHDAKECANRATIPLIVVVAASVLAIGSVPVLLIGLADWIASSTRLSAGSAQLIVGLISLVLAAVAGTIALRASLRSLESFRRSKEELTRNLSWVRTVLVHSGRTVARPRV
jgi:Putative Actinobacterial Holin-X, holin superfamily III